MNKNGQIVSIIVAIGMIFMVAVTVFFMNNLTVEIFTEFENVLESDELGYNNTEVSDTISNIRFTEENVWDYAVFAVIMGMIIQLSIFAFATRISPVFYWVYAFSSLLVLFIGAILSNIWQEMVANPELASSIARFPLTDAVLGNAFVLFASSLVIVLGIIITFGKSPGESPEVSL